MILGELITVSAYKLPLNVFVFNNSTLGMVKLEMLVNGYPDFAVDVPMVDFAALAGSLGFLTQRVTDPADLDAAIETALAHAGPALVDIVPDPTALSMPATLLAEQVPGFRLSLAPLASRASRGGG